jgi:cell division ATPase FtsA
MVTITQFNTGKSFIFNHRHLAEAERRVPRLQQGRILSGQSVIASMLNGYDTTHPYGRYVSRAEIVLLTSTLEKEAAQQIEKSLQRAFHTHELKITAFAPIAYEVFRALYPHQEDFIVLDVSGSGTDIIMVKRGLLSAVVAVPFGTHELCSMVREASARAQKDAEALISEPVNAAFEKECEEIQKSWIVSLHAAFLRFSTKEALPRTIFLLADTDVRAYIKRILDERELKSLWLTDDPLSIIALEPSHLASRVTTRGQGTGDLYMALLALFVARTEEK